MTCYFVGIAIVALTVLQVHVQAFQAFPRNSVFHRTLTNNVKFTSLELKPQMEIHFSNKWLLRASPSSVEEGGDDEDDDLDVEHAENYAKFLREQFTVVSGGSPTIDFETFLQWDEVHQLLEEELISREELQSIWSACVPDGKMNEEQFVNVNQALDSYFEEQAEDIEDADDYGDDEEEEESMSSRVPLKDLLSKSELGAMAEGIEPTVWVAGLDSKKLFESDFLEYLTQSFDSLAVKGQLTYDAFAAWDDVKSLLDEGHVDDKVLSLIWNEAIEYQHGADKVQDKDIKDFSIDLDTFLRLSYRLDDMMDEFQDALKSLTDQDVEDFYRSEFKTLTGGGELLTYDSLLKWPFLQETLESYPVVTQETLSQLWAGLPKKVNDQGESAIDEAAFLELNQSIDEAAMGSEEEDDEEEVDAGHDDATNNVLQ